MVADAAIRPGELVLDIGAGVGGLTAHLLDRGASVVAVELHPARADRLRRRFGGVTVIEADALSLPLPHRPFRVVACPPYAISTALIRRLLERGSRLVAADLVLQQAVVARHSDGRWSPRWDVQRGRSVPRRAFWPPPKVDSAVLVVRHG